MSPEKVVFSRSGNKLASSSNAVFFGARLEVGVYTLSSRVLICEKPGLVIILFHPAVVPAHKEIYP